MKEQWNLSDAAPTPGDTSPCTKHSTQLQQMCHQATLRERRCTFQHSGLQPHGVQRLIATQPVTHQHRSHAEKNTPGFPYKSEMQKSGLNSTELLGCFERCITGNAAFSAAPGGRNQTKPNPPSLSKCMQASKKKIKTI